MGEHLAGHQLTFEPLKEHDSDSTHTVLPGARIRVQSKHSSFFAWATSESEFDVAMQDKNEEPHHEPSMRYCLAMAAFSVFYSQHNSSAHYEAGHPLFIFPPGKENHSVVRIPKTRVAKK